MTSYHITRSRVYVLQYDIRSCCATCKTASLCFCKAEKLRSRHLTCERRAFEIASLSRSITWGRCWANLHCLQRRALRPRTAPRHMRGTTKRKMHSHGPPPRPPSRQPLRRE